MREELITSGRMNLNIDPVLHVWHWQIPIYLFLGGLAAGILFFAAYFTISGKEVKYPTAVKTAPIIVPFAIVLGLIALLLDLKHPAYFWQLYTTIRLQSPMSWGAWVLMLVMPVSIIWVISYLKEVFPRFESKNKLFSLFVSFFIKSVEGNGNVNWDWKNKYLAKFDTFIIKNRIPLAWIVIVLAVILGVYTGILLSAFNARPLWNTSLLGPLFLTSGLSTAAALIMWISKNHDEKKVFSRIDLLLITIELFFITHMFMGFLASSQVQVDAAKYFLGGEFTITFWVNVVVLGLVVPAILEILELSKVKIPIMIPAVLILWGGLMFRFIMVEAGQVTRFLY